MSDIQYEICSIVASTKLMWAFWPWKSLLYQNKASIKHFPVHYMDVTQLSVETRLLTFTPNASFCVCLVFYFFYKVCHTFWMIFECFLYSHWWESDQSLFSCVISSFISIGLLELFSITWMCERQQFRIFPFGKDNVVDCKFPGRWVLWFKTWCGMLTGGNVCL